MDKGYLWKLGIASITGFVMGVMLVGIAVAAMVLAVMFNWIPGVHLVDGLRMVWIDKVNGQVSVSVREGVLLPALVVAAGNALLVRFLHGKRKAA